MTGAILEVAKLMLSAYFSYARLQGASDEELDGLYSAEKEKFNNNNPLDLPDAGE